MSDQSRNDHERENVYDLQKEVERPEDSDQRPVPNDGEEMRNDSEKRADDQSTDADLYAVRDPEPRVYPERVAPQPDLSQTVHEGKTKGKGIDANEEEISLDAIYNRRREQRLSNSNEEDEEIEIPDPPELPPHPFATRFLHPFFQPVNFLKYGLLVTALWVLFIPATFLFSQFGKEWVNGPSSQENPSARPVVEKRVDSLHPAERVLLPERGEILLGAFYRYGWFFIAALILWGIIAVPFLLQLFAQTSAGDDRLLEWPQWTDLASLGQLLWIVLLFVIAGIPGYFLFLPVGLGRPGFFLVALILFPIFFLSSMETDSLFNLLSKNILRSFRKGFRFWRTFYLLTIPGWIVTFILFLLTVGYRLEVGKDWKIFLLLSAIAAILLSFALLIYFRILGRLAWGVQTVGREEPSEESLN